MSTVLRDGDDIRSVSGPVVGQSRTERFRAFERRYSAVSRVFDDLVPVPGTEQRLGLDPVIGLIPWFGDLVSAGVGFWLIAEAARFRIPRVVLARMVINTSVDLLIGLIPFLGDLFDVVSRSNRRNLELFRRYATDASASTAEHRAFLAGLGLVVIGLLWLAATLIGWLLSIVIPVP
jgi:Domain of unknown function (DUF4112)